MLKRFAAACLLSACILAGMAEEEMPGKVIFTFGFEKGQIAPESIPSIFSWSAFDGRDNTGTLKVVRGPQDKYKNLHIPLPEMVPGRTYELSLYAKGHTEPADKSCMIFCIEFFDKNEKLLSGHYQNISGLKENEWTRYCMKFVPKHGKSGDLILTIGGDRTGHVSFDDVTLSEGGIVSSVVLSAPSKLRFVKGRNTFRLSSDAGKNLTAQVHVTNNGKESDLELKSPDGFFEGAIPALEPGSVTLKVTILNEKGEKKCNGEFSLIAEADANRAVDNVTTDAEGRTFIGGKPFMPIGLYTLAKEMNETSCRQIAEGGFNVVIPYGPRALKGNTDLKDRWKNNLAAFDILEKHEIRVLYPLMETLAHKVKNRPGMKPYVLGEEAARNLMNHRALLGWYLSDEDLRGDFPYVYELRRRISTIDRNHLTYAVNHRFDRLNLPLYAIGADVIGCDPYPIDQSPIRQSIAEVRNAMNFQRTAGVPCWAVVQAFPWAIYRGKEKLKESYFPSEEEIRSQAITDLLYGAKGIIFYSHFDVTTKIEELMPGRSKTEWGKVVRVATLLKELEPFIMSRGLPESLRIDSIPAEEVIGGIFRHNGEVRILLVNTGLKCRGTFAFASEKPLRSKYGRTRFLGKGRYEFTADAVASDVLY